jgi:filamentous hemagglutinin family protein
MSDRFRSHRLGPSLLTALLATGPVQAQIVTDGSVGSASHIGRRESLPGPNVKIGAELGTRRGDNLFHSFEKFSIANGATATFTGPGDIKNVISRVTGGEISHIDGTLASRVGQADLYFINPAGVMFGPNAQLDVPGPFHVSTAHELRFRDGVRFSTVDKAGSSLTVAAPEEFGFPDQPVGRIVIDKTGYGLPLIAKNRSLVGGDIDVFGGFALSTGGSVFLSSAGSDNYVRADDGSIGAGSKGVIRITDGGIYGKTHIHAGTLSIVENSSIYVAPSSFGEQEEEQGTGAGIELKADSIEIAKSFIMANTIGPISPGPIIITANDLKIREGATIIRSTYNTPDSDTVVVQARHLSIADQFSGIFNTSEASGQGGRIEIVSDTINLRNGGVISTGT